MIRKMRLATKIGTGFGLLVMIAVALGGMAVQSLGGGVINTTTNGPSQVGNLLNNLLKKPK